MDLIFYHSKIDYIGEDLFYTTKYIGIVEISRKRSKEKTEKVSTFCYLVMVTLNKNKIFTKIDQRWLDYFRFSFKMLIKKKKIIIQNLFC